MGHPKLDAYDNYIDRVRAAVFLAVDLYEHREGIRPSDGPEPQLRPQLSQAAHLRGRAFERIMLLAGDEVVEAAHALNAVALEIDWQSPGKTPGTLDTGATATAPSSLDQRLPRSGPHRPRRQRLRDGGDPPGPGPAVTSRSPAYAEARTWASSPA